jgi:putative transposase
VCMPSAARVTGLRSLGIKDSHGGGNAKRIYRLYTEEQLIVRSKRRRKIARCQRGTMGIATAPNQCWTTDFDESSPGIAGSKGGTRRLPASITVDNGTAFCSRALEAGAMGNDARIRPGRPVENGLIESFNGRGGTSFERGVLCFAVGCADEAGEVSRTL